MVQNFYITIFVSNTPVLKFADCQYSMCHTLVISSSTLVHCAPHIGGKMNHVISSRNNMLNWYLGLLVTELLLHYYKLRLSTSIPKFRKWYAQIHHLVSCGSFYPQKYFCVLTHMKHTKCTCKTTLVNSYLTHFLKGRVFNKKLGCIFHFGSFSPQPVIKFQIEHFSTLKYVSRLF